MEITVSNLKENLTELMKARDWSGQEVARRSNQNVNDIYNILHGRSKKPSAEKVQAIAQAFGISVSAILNGASHKQDPAKPGFISPNEEWDGILYFDSMSTIRDVLAKQGREFANQEEERSTILRLTMRVYNFARKHNALKPDLIFAEDIINQE